LDKLLYLLAIISILEVTISLTTPDLYPFTWLATLFRIVYLVVLVR